MVDPLKDLSTLIKEYNLENTPLCLHTSFKSIAASKCSPREFIQPFLDAQITLLVPTHSWRYLTRPNVLNRPIRNAWNYSGNWSYSSMPPYTPNSKEIDPDMGIIPKTILQMDAVVRGNNPLCSFSAIGPEAHTLCDPQSPMNVTAPLQALIDLDGSLLCIGVDLTKMTLIHLAEQLSGRSPFLRWAKSTQNDIIPVQVGGCSEGFNKLGATLEPHLKRIKIGNAESVLCKARIILEKTVEAIQADPTITQCSEGCPVCNDAVAGGALY